MMTLSNDPTAPDFDLAASMAEADRLLREAGWRALPQWKTNEYARANLVAGITPDGLSCHVKDWSKIPPGHPQHSDDTPDTPHEAAAWLVRKFTNAPVFAVAEAPEAAENAGDETHSETGGEAIAMGELQSGNAGRSEGIPERISDVGGGGASGDQSEERYSLASDLSDEVIADETPELPESQAADQGDAPASGAVDSGDEGAGEGASGGVADAASGTAIQRGQVHDEPGPEGSGGGDGNYAIDADFEETGDEPEVIEDDSLGLGSIEDHTAAPDVTAGAPDMPSGGVVYFGDDIHVARLAKIGRLNEIANEKVAALQEGWTVEEFASLQNMMFRMRSGGEIPHDPKARERHDWIDDRSRAMRRVEKFKSEREAELEAHGALLKSEDPYDRETARLSIAAFDPEVGWP